MLSRLRIGTRLGVAFALLAVLAGVTGGVGFVEIRAQSATAADLRGLTETADDVQQMQFLLADLTGWQGFEGLDVAAIGPTKALLASSQNVVGFAADKSAIYALIQHWHAAAMNAAETAKFAAIPPAWDSFFAGSAKIEKLWRTNTQASYLAADVAMNSGFNSDQYDAVLHNTMAIKSSIDKRRSALERNQALESSRAQLAVILTLVLVIVVAAGAATLVTRSVLKPLRRCVATLRAVASGDLTARAPVVGSDELAALATELNQSTENTSRAVASMGRTGTDLAVKCDALMVAAEHGTDASRAANSECAQAAAQTNEVSSHIAGIESSTDQMRSAITEISLNAGQAANVAQTAVASAQQMTTVMDQLGDASAEISNVVKLIAAIASQTNLLALNATIEAARAGEAGKGFAVVASEVKELAQQTGSATQNISTEVQAMLNAVAEAVTAIERVSHVIDEISDFQTAIASAVEQQTATTSEINRSVIEASGGASTVTQSVGVAAQASSEVLDAIHHVSAVTTDIAQLSARLQDETRRFTYVD